jgi:hypothetical protein
MKVCLSCGNRQGDGRFCNRSAGMVLTEPPPAKRPLMAAAVKVKNL